MEMRLNLTTLDTRETTSLKALVDSGCMMSSIDAAYVRRMKLSTKPAATPTPVFNADRTINGYVKEYVDIEMEHIDSEGNAHREVIELQVVNLGGKHNIFIGYDWLWAHNPLVDWKTGTLEFGRCPPQCLIQTKSGEALTMQEYLGEGNEYAQAIRAVGITDAYGPIPDQYQEFADVFEEKGFDQLPERRPWDHAIEIEPGAERDRKLKGKVYALSDEEDKALHEFLQENLRTGRIRPSKSPIAAPFFFVKKKDGKFRPVQDYRRLNEVTRKDSWPLPLISDVLTKIKGKKILSKFDLRWGFPNVRIKEGDEWKAAFITSEGTYEPTVMFFGLTNAPATFQHMMDDIFGDLVRAGKVIIYIDDILIYTDTLDEHREITREVLKRLRNNKLFLNMKKCVFEQSSVDFLGLVVGNGEVRMHPEKVEAIKNWPIPKDLRGVRAFMQTCNFYRSFIPHFADITRPFNALTKKNVLFQWGPEQQEAFDLLKKAMMEEVTLLLPVPGAKFRLETDASDYAVGAVLHQIIEGQSRPLGFFSKTLQPAERNYEIYDKEMLAIMMGLENWRHFLRNSPEFEVWSDHQNLQYFRNPQKLNRRQARWYTELQDYHFKLHHRPGKLNIVADALSRKDQPEGGVENDNADVTVLDDSKFAEPHRLLSVNRLTFRDEEEIMEEIRRYTQKRDEKVKKGLLTDKANFVETNGVVEYRGLVYVPRNRKLREKIIYAHHDTPLAGHPGRHKTTELIQRSYWWPGMQGHLNKYVAACEVCQRTKPRVGAAAAPLHPNPVPQEPWHDISVDLIGPLGESRGYDAIMVVVDRLTKMVIAIPTNTTQSSLGTARLLRDHVIKRFGIPKKVISDRGRQFVSEFMNELYKMLDIEPAPSTAYHPETNGQTERENAEIVKYLRQFCNNRKDDWAEWLALAEFAINNRATSTTGQTPFFLNHGRHPRTGVTPKATDVPEADKFARDMKGAWEEAKAALDLVAETMKRQFDRSRRPSRNYKIGDMVWLETTNIAIKGAAETSKKLQDKRHGPFQILEKVGTSAYKLKTPETWEGIHPVFNEKLLTPYVPPYAKEQRKPPPPPPEVIDKHEEYEIEEILDSRPYRRSKTEVQYLIKWKGYDHSENKWIHQGNCHADRLVKEFHEKFPDKPKPTQARRTRKRVRFLSTSAPAIATNTQPGACRRLTAGVRPSPLIASPPSVVSYHTRLALRFWPYCPPLFNPYKEWLPDEYYDVAPT